MNILIVEDTYYHQKILTHLFKTFEDIKINSFVSENGKEALEFIKSTDVKIDLIFSDVKMPIMDGVEFCDEFRKIDTKTPIVMVTCNHELHNSYTVPTASHFMKKPYDFELIRNIVDYYHGIIDHSKNKMAYK